jgi:hypothetical protein
MGGVKDTKELKVEVGKFEERNTKQNTRFAISVIDSG